MLWIVLAVVLAGTEVFTGTFILIMLAVAAAIAALVAGLDASYLLQSVTFVVASSACLLGVRPVLRRALTRNAVYTPMGIEAIEDTPGLVLERVDLDHGLVKIDGEMWSARPYDATQTFEAGERVRVVAVRGATALVWRE